MSTLVRRTVCRLVWVAWLTAALSLLVVPAAGAYIDPGSGSVVFQALIAGAMGASLAIKVYWRRLTRFVSRLLGRSVPTDEAEADIVDSADPADTADTADTADAADAAGADAGDAGADAGGGADTAGTARGADAVADVDGPAVTPNAADGQALQQPR